MKKMSLSDVLTYFTKSKNRIFQTIGFYIVLALILLVFLFPLFWLISTAFKQEREFFSIPPVWVSSEPTMHHFERSIWEFNFFHPFKNSLIIAIGTTLISLGVASMAGYSLARFRFKGRADIALWILSLRIMPPIAVAIPYFLMMRSYRLLDTHLGLMIVYLVFNLPFAVWMLSSYLQDLPIELEEAAWIDGCSRIGSFIRIIFPLALPGIIATGIFCFIVSWNEYLFALLFSRAKAITIPVILSSYLYRGVEWGPLSASGFMAILPVFVLTLIVQKHLIRVMTFGALK